MQSSGFLCLGGRFGFFLLFFSARGGGRESEAPGGGRGDRFCIENSRRRGGSPVQEGPRGREGGRGELGNFGGGGG